MAYIWKMAFSAWSRRELRNLDEAVRALSGQKKYQPVVEAWTHATKNGLVPPAVQELEGHGPVLLVEVEIPRRSAEVREAVEDIFNLAANLEVVYAGYYKKNVLKDTNPDTFFPREDIKAFYHGIGGSTEKLELRYGPQWIGNFAFLENAGPDGYEYDLRDWDHGIPKLTEELIGTLWEVDRVYEVGSWDDCDYDMDRLIYDLPCRDGTARVQFLRDEDGVFQMYRDWKWGVYNVNGKNPAASFWAFWTGSDRRFLPPIPQYAFVTDLLRLE